jgi:uncharacterized Zn finger protein (UPF0148 family)
VNRRPTVVETLRLGWKAPVRRAAAAKGRKAGSPPASEQRGRRRAGKPDGVALRGQSAGETELVQQRDKLSRQFAELQWDLGGIAYEMASRDHFRMDVLMKQAAKLQEVDAQLGQVERLLKLGEAGAAGTCPACGAMQARGAVFCWQCGKELRPKMEASGKPKSASGEAKTEPQAAREETAAKQQTGAEAAKPDGAGEGG